MTTFTSVSPRMLTEDQLDDLVRDNGGFLGCYGYGFSCPDRGAGYHVGGWRVSLIDTRGMGNHGSFVVIATDEPTWRHQRDATLRMFRDWTHQAEGRHAWRDNGTLDIACALVPWLHSDVRPRRGALVARDEAWRYYACPHANFVRVGDDRWRVWARPVRP